MNWGKNWSLILSKSKQALTEIGKRHNFVNFTQRKGSQGETREQIVTDFWDTIYPKKVPSVIFATIAKKTGYHFMAFPCAMNFWNSFCIKSTIFVCFCFEILCSRQIFNQVPLLIPLCQPDSVQVFTVLKFC